MVKKTKAIHKPLKPEKYFLILLIISYAAGVCSGSYFSLSSSENTDYIKYLFFNSSLNSIIYFIIALLLKYSGILNGVLYIIPFFTGIQNSASYCKNIIQNSHIITYNYISEAIRDSAVLMLLILYIIIIMTQILNKKYNIKKDLKYFSVYFLAVLTIYILFYILNNFIFYFF